MTKWGKIGDNDKLLGLAFDLTCGCTVLVESIFAVSDLININKSQIRVGLKIITCCEKAHRSDVTGSTYSEEIATFMDSLTPSYSKKPPLNTIQTMKGKRQGHEEDE